MKTKVKIIPKLAAVGVVVAVSNFVCSSSAAVIDLLTANTSQPGPLGSVYKQVGTGSGTGNFDPFLTLNNGNNAVLEGYNTDQKNNLFYPDTSAVAAGRTHSLTFGQLRYLEINLGGGTQKYLRFSLDINEANSAAAKYLALNDFKIFAPPGAGFATYNGSLSGLGGAIYDLDDGGVDRTVLLDYGLQTGSGTSDLDLFVPLSLFAGVPLDRSIVIYSKFGDTNGVSYPGIDSSLWKEDSGFEEWRLYTTDTPVAVPEPATVAFGLAMVGGLGLLEIRRRKNS